jgi:hypothetical protein
MRHVWYCARHFSTAIADWVTMSWLHFSTHQSVIAKILTLPYTPTRKCSWERPFTQGSFDRTRGHIKRLGWMAGVQLRLVGLEFIQCAPHTHKALTATQPLVHEAVLAVVQTSAREPEVAVWQLEQPLLQFIIYSHQTPVVHSTTHSFVPCDRSTASSTASSTHSAI